MQIGNVRVANSRKNATPRVGIRLGQKKITILATHIISVGVGNGNGIG
eukprot:CAMPEP_0172405212 /NCGR_PEP_ID=MMETSP1061-20121228/66365_1 /TAXON_ID=37318 /ORGANISM="Pseudo-nitzschia pungens, Strain cf. pungens" /LENGTH=47 /DNA_ID= /DNA_START= /DNA_END= /DNA_ORIENTATION=